MCSGLQAGTRSSECVPCTSRSLPGPPAVLDLSLGSLRSSAHSASRSNASSRAWRRPLAAGTTGQRDRLRPSCEFGLAETLRLPAMVTVSVRAVAAPPRRHRRRGLPRPRACSRSRVVQRLDPREINLLYTRAAPSRTAARRREQQRWGSVTPLGASAPARRGSRGSAAADRGRLGGPAAALAHACVLRERASFRSTPRTTVTNAVCESSTTRPRHCSASATPSCRSSQTSFQCRALRRPRHGRRPSACSSRAKACRRACVKGVDAAIERRRRDVPQRGLAKPHARACATSSCLALGTACGAMPRRRAPRPPATPVPLAGRRRRLALPPPHLLLQPGSRSAPRQLGAAHAGRPSPRAAPLVLHASAYSQTPPSRCVGRDGRVGRLADQGCTGSCARRTCSPPPTPAVLEAAALHGSCATDALVVVGSVLPPPGVQGQDPGADWYSFRSSSLAPRALVELAGAAIATISRSTVAPTRPILEKKYRVRAWDALHRSMRPSFVREPPTLDLRRRARNRSHRRHDEAPSRRHGRRSLSALLRAPSTPRPEHAGGQRLGAHGGRSAVDARWRTSDAIEATAGERVGARAQRRRRSAPMAICRRASRSRSRADDAEASPSPPSRGHRRADCRGVSLAASTPTVESWGDAPSRRRAWRPRANLRQARCTGLNDCAHAFTTRARSETHVRR